MISRETHDNKQEINVLENLRMKVEKTSFKLLESQSLSNYSKFWQRYFLIPKGRLAMIGKSHGKNKKTFRSLKRPINQSMRLTMLKVSHFN